MGTVRTAEIAGGGFAGLAAACALAQRGWAVRVHERGAQLRSAGAGIYFYENGLRVLEALGALDHAIEGATGGQIREMRDAQDRVLSVYRWENIGRVFCIVRQRLLDALADAARRSGAEIVTGSNAICATPDGELIFDDGRREKADLIIGADGANSAVRESLDLVQSRKFLPDGAIRVLLDKTDAERTMPDTGTTREYWEGSRRLLCTQCSDDDIFVALTMRDSDVAHKKLPIDVDLWSKTFPSLRPILERFGDKGRYDRFGVVKPKSWSSGRAAIIGDAANALPPNLGQGGGTAVMNALSLSVYLEQTDDVPSALAAWEKWERPMTNHTQRMSIFYGTPTTWSPPLQRLFFGIAGRSKYLRNQRMKTARHHPTGTALHPEPRGKV